MAQGSRVQAHPSLYSLPTQNPPIYLLEPDFNSAINQQNKQMRKSKRKQQEGDKGLGILWSYRFTDKRAVMKGCEKCWGTGWWRVQGLWVHVRVCTSVRLTPDPAVCIQNKRSSLFKERHCICPAGGCAWMNKPSERECAQKTFTSISVVWIQ